MNEENASLTLEDIREEALFEVFSFLEAVDLCYSLARISKRFNEFSQSQYLWRKLCERHFNVKTKGNCSSVFICPFD